MKIRKFVLRLLAFSGCFVCILFIFWQILLVHRAEICRTNANKLFLGTSRIQYSVDDRMISGALNAGLNADNYIFSYLKLKLLKKYNPQIDSVYLICDEGTVFSSFHTSEDKFHPFYWDLLDYEDLKNILLYDKDCFSMPLHWLKILPLIKSFYAPVKFQELGIGQFSELYRDKLQEDISRHKKKNHVKLTVDKMQKIYLDRIVAFCKQNRIHLFLINTPSHKISYEKESVDLLHSFINKNYSEIPYYNFQYIDVPDSCFGDIGHLNYRGAKYFTSFLIDTLHLNSIKNE